MQLDWSPSRRHVDDLRDVPAATAALQEAHKKKWRHHRTLIRLYQEHYPTLWPRIQHCRTRGSYKSGHGRTPVYAVEVEGCGVQPFCPACNDQTARRRASRAVKALRRCTPEKEAPRAVFVTFAPGGWEGRDEWQQVAMNNHREYMRASYSVLEWMYGENIGAVGVYQAYGERPFVEPHPHVHWIVNGWTSRTGAPSKAPRYGLEEGGARRLKEQWAKILEQRLGVTNVPLDTLHQPDLRISKYGYPGIHRAARYMYRELIDPVKWQYDSARQIVELTDYHDVHASVEITVDALKNGIQEYGATLGQWGRRGPRAVDMRCGELADRHINKTARIMGSVEEHDEGCLCGICVDWSHSLKLASSYDAEALEADERPW